MNRLAVRLLLCSWLVWCAAATEVGPDYTIYMEPGYPSDPILSLRPPFPRSLPVQVLLTGIVLTLASVLLIQLFFTAQYHWPMAPVNFVLQISAVCTLLVTSIVTTHIILSTVAAESRTWPYMLNYLAVDIPPSSPVYSTWPIQNLAAWCLMTATCSGLIQITHIQFLTLLFPSKLEKRLIYILLAPLAITSAAMQLMHISARHKLLESVTAVQNICNATLSLLFTASLFIWGFLVNRKNAWRMDGGTAAFGVGALTLAPMSTAVAFVYVPTKEQYTWMPQLMWAIILWQSFLGWWWWVGAGMGVGELDDLLYREEKRKQKRAVRSARRRERRERAETVWKGVTGALGLGRSDSEEPDVREMHHPSLNTLASSGDASRRRAVLPAGRRVYDWFLHWRREHLRAAREQAVERVQRSRQESGRRDSLVGWGLGSFGLAKARQLNDDETVVGSDSDCEVEADHGQTLQVEADRKGDAYDELPDKGLRVRHRICNHEQEAARRDTGEVRRITDPAASPRSLWWWGPLRRWRMQDSTVY